MERAAHNFFHAIILPMLTVPLPSFLSSLFSDDPQLRFFQIMLTILGFFFLYLLLFTLRDILLRTRSFLYQLASIVLVAFLPGVGFLFYLLIRPARTLKEREMEAMVLSLTESLYGGEAALEFAEEEESVQDVPLQEGAPKEPQAHPPKHTHRAHDEQHDS